jgi:hypothetical protein
VTIDPLPVGAHEDRPVAALADREVDGPGRAGRQRHGDNFAALAQDGERAVPSLEPEVPDLSAESLGHP